MNNSLFMSIDEALRLAGRIASGNYSPDELNQFFGCLDSADPEQVSQILDTYQQILNQQDDYRLHVRQDFIDRLSALKPSTKEVVPEIPSAKSGPKINWLNWAAAAAVLLMVAGGYLYFNHKPEKADAISSIRIPADIKAPQSSRATITLANGRKIFLDSASNGTLVNQGNMRVLKLADGQIAYQGSSREIVYNTLSNPRGSKPVSMTLSDGSKVWLNVGSSLTYPMAFTGKERTVEITGEAYFEVAPNSVMPFTVKKLNDDTKIRVLGTHFNVCAYDDEAAIKVSLLEGAVNVSRGGSNRLLKPGEQAQMDKAGIEVVSDVDMDEVMAWKNGKFRFGEKADIASIMRQIARWYDIDVSYQGEISGHIGGSISQNANVSQVLKMLEATGSVHFRIEGRQVTVMP